MNERSNSGYRPHLTLRDVSEASGVSEMTVSRVLRNRGDVSEKTRLKVMEAAKLLGYVPNKIAGALASNRVNLVGVIIPSLSNMVFPEVLMGISGTLEASPLQPVFGVTDYDPEREEKVIFEMLSWRPSGLIIAGLEHTPAAQAMMRNAGIPIVEIMDVDGEPIRANVGISHTRAGRETAKEILKRGYRKIGFLGTKMPLDHRARKRFEGFNSILQESGLTLAAEEYYSGGSALKKGREMTRAILETNKDLDFLYYSNDMIGAGGLLYCREAGLQVPQDIGLAGFNGVELIEGLPIRLATMDSCRVEIGRAAAGLIAQDQGKSDEPFDKRIELEPVFEPGDTVRGA
ncbi:MAG: LacI family DNA-binding transcriptional regulator [Pseudomonadota bacterium]